MDQIVAVKATCVTKTDETADDMETEVEDAKIDELSPALAGEAVVDFARRHPADAVASVANTHGTGQTLDKY